MKYARDIVGDYVNLATAYGIYVRNDETPKETRFKIVVDTPGLEYVLATFEDEGKARNWLNDLF